MRYSPVWRWDYRTCIACSKKLLYDSVYTIMHYIVFPCLQTLLSAVVLLKVHVDLLLHWYLI